MRSNQPPMLGTIVCQSKHPDGDLIITEHKGARHLYLGSDALQSAMTLTQPNALKLSYTQSMMAFLLFTPQPQRGLLFGLGGGALAKYLFHAFNHIQLDVVELRDDVIRAAHSHFFVPLDPRINIIQDDANHYAKQSITNKYDVIFVDAYDQNGLAHGVSSPSFYKNCFQQLNNNGILVLNMWATSSHQLKQHIAQLHQHMSIKPLCLPVTDRGNVIVFISNNPFFADKLKRLKLHAQQLEQTHHLPFCFYLNQLIKQNSLSWLQKLFG